MSSGNDQEFQLVATLLQENTGVKIVEIFKNINHSPISLLSNLGFKDEDMIEAALLNRNQGLLNKWRPINIKREPQE